METKKYVILSAYFNEANWYGKFDNPILIKLEYRKTRKSTGLLTDTLWFESEAFCEVDPKTRKFIMKEKFIDTQMLNTNANAGSYVKYMNYNVTILKKIRKALKEAGYIIVDEVRKTLPVALEKMKNYIPNDYDLIMTKLFN